ncbi:hypothetical protein DH2020_005306 [Rehmannia glutinosa]|uniref:Uncharacterized protein n=1 Tax=Rehmannia glutinosa TaxID=99300 RepID=A0ABR0XFR0_REHGL
MPLSSTTTNTRKQTKFPITGEFSETIIAVTKEFSFSIVVAAISPHTPTNSGHDCLPRSGRSKIGGVNSGCDSDESNSPSRWWGLSPSPAHDHVYGGRMSGYYSCPFIYLEKREKVFTYQNIAFFTLCTLTSKYLYICTIDPINDVTLFTLKINHAGVVKYEYVKHYLEGSTNYFDRVDGEMFEMIELKDFIEQIGYNSEKVKLKTLTKLLSVSHSKEDNSSASIAEFAPNHVPVNPMHEAPLIGSQLIVFSSTTESSQPSTVKKSGCSKLHHVGDEIITFSDFFPLKLYALCWFNGSKKRRKHNSLLRVCKTSSSTTTIKSSPDYQSSKKSAFCARFTRKSCVILRSFSTCKYELFGRLIIREDDFMVARCGSFASLSNLLLRLDPSAQGSCQNDVPSPFPTFLTSLSRNQLLESLVKMILDALSNSLNRFFPLSIFLQLDKRLISPFNLLNRQTTGSILHIHVIDGVLEFFNVLLQFPKNFLVPPFGSLTKSCHHIAASCLWVFGIGLDSLAFALYTPPAGNVFNIDGLDGS